MNIRTWLLLPASVVALAACAVSGEYDQRFGQSVREAAALQTLNPGAGKSTAPAATDAQTAVSAIHRHRGTFDAPPPSFSVINIGGGH